MFWNESFIELFHQCVEKYRNGDKNYQSYYNETQHDFLKLIGYKPREFFDFVEDYCDSGTPSPTTALLVAAVRRDFFLVAQESRASNKEITSADVPAFEAQLEGIGYLPRILAKARAKLKGELDPDLMFCCGADRKFLRGHGNLHPADFLRHVWAAEEDDAKVAEFVRGASS